MLSIDQNCHSLWDVPAKLHALSRLGRAVTHFIEDIDAAFTSLGSGIDAGDLRLARERYHRSGGSDWGAALFYTEFLGRVPVEIRDWAPATGLKTNALAKQLGRSVDALYDEFSPGDNWQLVGSSFVGDRQHHRVIGDLTVRETADFLRELMARARADMLGAFPSSASRQRLSEWFGREEARLKRLLEDLADARLVQLYERWLGELLAELGAGAIHIDLTSRLFACREDLPGAGLLERFLSDYDRTAGSYNEAVAESGRGLRPLQTKDGELPFFATVARADHLVRTGVFLRAGRLCIGERSLPPGPGGRLPWRDLAAAGIRCIAGKALVLVSQARLGPHGQPLAVPYRGSLYMPAAHLLARKLREAGLLPGELRPIVRVRLRLLDRMRSLDTPIRLPRHLAEAMGEVEVPARRLGESYAELMAEAKRRRKAFEDAGFRGRWQRESFPRAFDEIDALDARRRELARRDAKAPELREIWQRVRDLQRDVLDRTVRRIDRDTQVAEVDYYDSRGAILPWCMALGGEAFYNEVIAAAEVHEEDSLRAPDDAAQPPETQD